MWRTWNYEAQGAAHRVSSEGRGPGRPPRARSAANMNPASTFDRVFTTTRWSIVLSAGRRESHRAEEALDQLCRGYWYPIYVFLRRSGLMRHDAEDLTQAFFERVLSKEYLRAVDPTKGRFRCFL